MLCEKCANVKVQELFSERGYEHYKSWADLVLSASRGCETCEFVREQNTQREASFKDGKPLRWRVLKPGYDMVLGATPFWWTLSCSIYVTEGISFFN